MRKYITTLLICLPFCLSAAPDILISDFEFKSWTDAGWVVTGSAFGEGPSTGPVDKQSSLANFKGKRLANSFHGGDRSEGRVTSPPFKIERSFINFLIGAGGWKDKTCLNLVIDGRVVRSTTGDRINRGGDEALSWKTWDVSSFLGKSANIEIVDRQSGRWGHISVDHIIQSEQAANRESIMEYLPSESEQLLERLLNHERIPPQKPGTLAYTKLLAEIEQRNGKDDLTLNDQLRGTRQLLDRLWNDPMRPRYHLLAPPGYSVWNDINGAIYWKGRYHLFVLGRETPEAKAVLASEDTMRPRETWLHASSADLVHWIWHPPALVPRFDGTMPRGIYSGGAVIGTEKPTLIYYVPGQGICISTSDDDDLLSWTPSPHNPVIPVHQPKGAEFVVFDPMAWKEGDVYYALIGNKNKRPGFEGDTTSLFKSKDLINWTYLHPLYKSDRKWTHVDTDAACPDFFPIGNGKHMLITHVHAPMNGTQYYIGTFRDEVFHPEQHGYMNWPGGQLNAPETMLDGKGRRLFWGWVGEPRATRDTGWASVVSLPRVLSLDEENNLQITPPAELEALRTNHRQMTDITMEPGKEWVLPQNMNGNSMEIRLTIEASSAETFGIKVLRSPGGEEETAIEYSPKEQTLSIVLSKSTLNPKIRYNAYHLRYATGKNIPEENLWTTRQTAPLVLRQGEPLKLRIFIDRSIMEVFANDRQVITQRIYPTREDSTGISLYSQGTISIPRIDVWNLSPTNSW